MNVFQGQGNPKQKASPGNWGNMDRKDYKLHGQIFRHLDTSDHHCGNWMCNYKKKKTIWRHSLFQETNKSPN